MDRSIDHYELLEELGRGGMGAVYRARDARLGREVALKLILPAAEADPDSRRRFQSEAEALARLRHAHLVPVHEARLDRQPPYLVMGLIRGSTLQARLRDGGPLDVRVAARLTCDLARAVAEAHAHGIVHRDIKPDNVLIDDEGRPYLTDFGLVLSAGSEQARLTRTGEVLGTPSFMAPEQASGERVTTAPAVDVWGLGALLYASLTGQPPFQGGSVINVLNAVLHREPLPPRSLRPEIPAGLERVILRCLEKPPQARYPTAAELADALERELERPEPGAGRAARLTLGALVLIALTVGGIALARSSAQRSVSPKSPPPADASTARRATRLRPLRPTWPSEPARTFRHPDGACLAQAFLGSNEVLTLSTKSVVLHHGSTGAVLGTWPAPRGHLVAGLAADPSQRLAAWGVSPLQGSGARLQLLRRGRLARPSPALLERINRVVLSPDGASVAAFHDHEPEVALLRVGPPSTCRVTPRGGRDVRAIAFRPDGLQLAIARWDQERPPPLELYGVPSLEREGQRALSDRQTVRLRWTSEALLALACKLDQGRAQETELRAVVPQDGWRKLPLDRTPVATGAAEALAALGPFVVTGSRSGRLQVWRVGEQAPLAVVETSTPYVDFVAYEGWLLARRWKAPHEVDLWDLRRWREAD